MTDTIYTRKNLFDQLVRLEQQLAILTEDIKFLKNDFVQSEDNPDGLDKDEVKEIAAYAKKVVADKVENVIEQGEVFAKLKDEFQG